MWANLERVQPKHPTIIKIDFIKGVIGLRGVFQFTNIRESNVLKIFLFDGSKVSYIYIFRFMVNTIVIYIYIFIYLGLW